MQNPNLPKALLFCLALLVPLPAQAITLIINNNYPANDPSERFLSSTPYASEKLSVSPETITITFTRAVRADKSYIKVSDMFGTQLNKGDVLTEGASMSVYMPKLAPGNYRVRWRARCACVEDTDMSDNYRFTVLPQGQ